MARAMTDGLESEPFRLASSPSHLLHRVEQLAADRFAQLVGGDHVTLRQFTVLVAISQQPGLSQSELVRATGIDRSTLADMMTRMEKKGWVTRTPSTTDARALSIRMAREGSTLLAATERYAMAADAAILDALPRTKRKSFMNIITKLIRLADEAAAKAEREAKRKAERAKRARRRQSKRDARKQDRPAAAKPKREAQRKERS